MGWGGAQVKMRIRLYPRAMTDPDCVEVARPQGRAGFILRRSRIPGIRHKAAFCPKQMSRRRHAARDVCRGYFPPLPRLCATAHWALSISNRLPRQRLSPDADSLT